MQTNVSWLRLIGVIGNMIVFQTVVSESYSEWGSIILTRLYMKKHKKFFEKESEEEKELRWKKQQHLAKSFAKQNGIKIVQKKKTQSELYNY